MAAPADEGKAIVPITDDGSVWRCAGRDASTVRAAFTGLRERIMVRILVLVLAVAALVPAVSGQPNLAIVSGFDGSGSPYVRTEMLVLTLDGVEPFRPVSLFMGQPAAPFPIPSVDGQLAVNPGTLMAFGPYDGLGLFGGGFPLRADAAGQVSFPVVIPPNAGPLPLTLTIQGIALQNPFAAASFNSFVFSNGVTLTIDEPLAPPVITGFTDDAGNPLQFIAEGSSTPIRITGTGFNENSTVLPQVTFTSECPPGLSAPALSVLLVDSDTGPGVAPALRVVPPPFIGGPTAPPFTQSGPVRVTVDFSGTPLFPNTPANATTTTAPTGFADPTFFVFQTAVTPAVTGISPKAGRTVPVCPVTITGNGFLDCPNIQVFFDAGGAGEAPATNVVVVNATTITCDPPPHAEALAGVAVRNPDHFPTSPRQSALSPPATDFAWFAYVPTSVAVTAIAPPTIVEGTGGASIFITATCPQTGGYTALDPQSGPLSVNLGSNLNGTDASAPLTVVNVVVNSPGNVTIEALAPSLPPGLNPPGVTAGGRGNAGRKHVQIVAPPCLDPTATPHAAFAAIPGAKPGNVIFYLAQNPPAIASIAPNNCGREDGGQAITITGSGFFTNDSVLPSAVAVLGPQVIFGGAIPAAALANITIVNDTTITAVTPDLSALALALPFTLDAQVTNPDAQSSATAGAADDFHLYPSLSSTVANTFPTVPPAVLVDTTPGSVPQVFTFTGDLVLPAGLLVNAEGNAPLIIRCRGNVTIDGNVALDGASVTAAPYFHPAGAGRGGEGSNAGNLGIQDAFQGLFGASPTDSATGFPFNGFGTGGFHAVTDGGGGGGGAMLNAGLPGQPGTLAGGTGGAPYGFTPLRIPVLGGGGLQENLDPPGGSGGGAGGMGTPPPFNPAAPPAAADIGFGGAGGNGGGGVCIAADGIITVNGALIASGQDGGPGLLATNPANTGGGGGGGAGGAILLQAIQGIRVNAGANVAALGSLGGLGAAAGGGNDGGAASDGMIRFAIPGLSASPATVLVVNGAALVTPPADTTSY